MLLLIPDSQRISGMIADFQLTISVDGCKRNQLECGCKKWGNQHWESFTTILLHLTEGFI